MTDQKPKTYRLLELFRPVALVILTAISGIVVWSFHNFGWPGFLAYLLVCFVGGSVTGGVGRRSCDLDVGGDGRAIALKSLGKPHLMSRWNCGLPHDRVALRGGCR